MSKSSDFVIENGVLTEYTGTDENVIIPEGVTDIGKHAFWECKTMTDVTIPEGVTSIGVRAFFACINLKSVTIPEGVTSIKEETFKHCRNLKSISFPASLERIDKDAFYGCEKLTEVHIRDLTAWSSIQFESTSSYPFSVAAIGRNPALFLNGIPIKEVTFPEGEACPVIANFKYINQLTAVTIPDGVTMIADEAFRDCVNLEYVSIPESVTSIGECAFRSCTSLKSITIPDHVKMIGDFAFSECKNLTKVVLPENLQQMGRHVFAGCVQLKECRVPASVNRWGMIQASYEDGAYYTEKAGKREILEMFAPGEEDCIVPEWAVKIREGALTGTSFKRIIISESTLVDEDILYGFGQGNIEFDGSFMKARKSLPNHYIAFFEKTPKTPDLLAYRMLYQSGKQWNKALTEACETVDKAAIISSMAEIVGKTGAEKTAARLADTVLDYLPELEPASLQCAYSVLELGGYKALSKLVLSEAFQEKWKVLSDQNKKDSKTKNPIEKLAEENWKTTETSKVLRKIIEKGIHYRDSEEVSSADVLIFIINEYAAQLMKATKIHIRGIKPDYIVRIRVSEIADEIADSLDKEELRETLEKLAYKDNTFRNGYVLALARYASGKQISHLCSEIRERANWRKFGASGRMDVAIGRGALMLSETREGIIALDKIGALDYYASMRGTDAEIIRETVLADFGFDRNGKKTYDLGGNRVTVSIAEDLTLQLFDENAGKTVKSIPKKNAEPTLLEDSKADLSDLKKNIKRVIKLRRDAIFDDFLSGAGQSAVKWEKIYFGNPVLRAVAKLIVWQQGEKLFTMTDTCAADCHGNPVEIEDMPEIRVAHPVEMKAEEISNWQNYFIRNGLKQPFEQIWEPVYNPDKISRDRYAGVVLPIYRFENKDQHGIHSWGLTPYSENYGFDLDDCELDAEGSIGRIIPGVTNDGTYTLGTFRIIEHSRKSNHIIFVLDKWTFTERIEKDDSSIGEMLFAFTQAQITEFIRLANEKHCSNALAVLLDYKNARYGEADPFAEFTL